jgi:hypothetical protein
MDKNGVSKFFVGQMHTDNNLSALLHWAPSFHIITRQVKPAIFSFFLFFCRQDKPPEGGYVLT